MRAILLSALLVTIALPVSADYSVLARTVGEFDAVCTKAAQFDTAEEGSDEPENETVVWCRRSINEAFDGCWEVHLPDFMETFHTYKWDEEESLAAAMEFMIREQENDPC